MHTTRSGALQSLGLRPGQTFTAQVLSHTPDGSTQLQVGKHQLSLVLPSKAQIGTLLEFLFQSGGTKPQITLLGETTSPKPTQTQQTPKQPNPIQPPTTKTPIPPPTQSQISPQQNLSTQPQPSITLPPTTRAALHLYPSQTITANVIGTNPNGQTILQIGQQQFPATLPNNPNIGSNLQFQVQITGDQARLILSQQPTTTPPNQSTDKSLNQPQVAPPATKTNAAIPAQAVINQTAISQAISLAIPSSIARQDSIIALFANLTGLTKKQMQNLPPEVKKLAEQIQNTKLNFNAKPPTGESLKQTIKQSGIFMEATLVKPTQTPNTQTPISQITTSPKQTNQPPTPQNQTPAPTQSANPTTQTPTALSNLAQSDLKALLLLFKASLTKLTGEQTTHTKPEANRPPIPIKGTIPRTHNFNPKSTSQNQNQQNLTQTLLHQTEAALSRLRLFQITSLPEAKAQNQTSAAQELNLEIPFGLNGETGLIRFQISRDDTKNLRQGDNGWQLQFAINLSNLGEVGAAVSFRYSRVNSTIWAKEEKTAITLKKMLPELTNSLAAIGLETGSINIRHGAPKPQQTPYSTNIDNQT